MAALIASGTYLFCAETDNQPVKYRWPLNINNGFSQSFQEFSYNHFHGGIDLRTFQKTGYPVYAIAGGEIYKIRVVKRGSGRGLYLKHRDGNTSIYFHLDKFAPKLESILRQVQRARGRKYIENYFLKNPVPIKQGEVIAYSGETGSGFPHLHLEIRDRYYYAVNPFPLLKFPKKDNNFPVLKRIILRNRGDSLIDGEIGERSINFTKIESHRFAVKKPLLITGNFEVVLNAIDIADTGKYVAPQKISAYIDDERYFHLSFDRFKRDDNNQLGFVYDMFHTGSTSFFYNLFFQDGFHLEGDKNNFDTIIENISPGEHTLKIEVTDNHNNLCTGSLRFFKMQNPSIRVTGISKLPDGISLDIEELQAEAADRIIIKLYDRNNEILYTGSLNQRRITEKFPVLLKAAADEVVYMDFNFYNNKDLYFSKRFLLSTDHLSNISDISFDTFINRDDIYIVTEQPEIAPENIRLGIIQGKDSAIIQPQSGRNFLFFRFKPLNFDNTLLLRFKIYANHTIQAEIQERIQIIHLQEGVKRNFTYGDFSAEFFPRSVYEPKVLKVEEKKFPSKYPVLSKQVSLSPYNFPFLDTVYYKFKKNVANPKQAGIFKYSSKSKKWYYSYTTYDPANTTFRTRLISSGTFALMRDVFPPKIYFSRPRKKLLSSVKQLFVTITDKGKGVNDDTLLIKINNKTLDCEYDPDRNHVKIENLGAIQKGENRIYIRIKDHGGNTSSKTYRFYLN
ncbi:MAG: M23 family metallopeptidase [Candidatus Aminicenantes bacterium]|nr:M23 family metallopeptidase [Candidatus Aminicenantes bacterium]